MKVDLVVVRYIDENALAYGNTPLWLVKHTVFAAVGWPLFSLRVGLFFGKAILNEFVCKIEIVENVISFSAYVLFIDTYHYL